MGAKIITKAYRLEGVRTYSCLIQVMIYNQFRFFDPDGPSLSERWRQHYIKTYGERDEGTDSFTEVGLSETTADAVMWVDAKHPSSDDEIVPVAIGRDTALLQMAREHYMDELPLLRTETSCTSASGEVFYDTVIRCIHRYDITLLRDQPIKWQPSHAQIESFGVRCYDIGKVGVVN